MALLLFFDCLTKVLLLLFFFYVSSVNQFYFADSLCFTLSLYFVHFCHGSCDLFPYAVLYFVFFCHNTSNTKPNYLFTISLSNVSSVRYKPSPWNYFPCCIPKTMIVFCMHFPWLPEFSISFMISSVMKWPFMNVIFHLDVFVCFL